MSLLKSIASGYEHRKPYYKRAPRIDRTCRPHGSCPWCQRSRQHHIDVRTPDDDTVLPRGYVDEDIYLPPLGDTMGDAAYLEAVQAVYDTEDYLFMEG
jgi:hypothetical protein